MSMISEMKDENLVHQAIVLQFLHMPETGLITLRSPVYWLMALS